MNKLVIASGSNLGDSILTLNDARSRLESLYGTCEPSRFYTSKAVDYLDQPDFINQVLCFDLPRDVSPQEVLQTLLDIESDFGRKRDIFRGPRSLDLDLIFFGAEKHHTDQLQIPHPRFIERSFVVRPLLELSCAKWVTQNFDIPECFSTDAFPLE